MEFEHYTVALLVTNPDEPEWAEGEREALQDAHLSHLADLHEAGHLLAVGPLADPDGELRGLLLYRVGAEEAQALSADDPAVQAGAFLLRVIPWSIPAGGVHFTPTRLPRSLADVLG
jgi:uncharacterized protein YciI